MLRLGIVCQRSVYHLQPGTGSELKSFVSSSYETISTDSYTFKTYIRSFEDILQVIWIIDDDVTTSRIVEYYIYIV